MIRIELQKALDSAGGKMLMDISAAIPTGEFVAINGPSGAGKTSLLRMIAGFMMPDSGSILSGDETWFSKAKEVNLETQKRNIGFVFQDYALFPNMTVQGNLRYALAKGQNRGVTDELLEMMELQSLRNSFPDKLSGGQKQRVALARSLVRKPRLLLLDEPLAALDTEMRRKLQVLLHTAHREFGLTTLMVSHDVAEVFNLADRVLLLESGKIMRDGAPDQVFMDHRISGKFQVTGQVLKIEPEDIVYVVNVQAGNQIIRVVTTKEDVVSLKPGDKVLVSSKAFNPVIIKIG